MTSVPHRAQKGKGSKSQDFSTRFWSLVDKSDGCWEWQGSIDGKGYGRIYFRSFRSRAHRVSYILTYGEIPDGLVVCHRCDNPRCVRPDHLFLGTLKDNTQDMIRKGRNSPPPRNDGDVHWTRQHPEKLPRGEQHPTAKLTLEQVRDIRAKYTTGNYTLTQLGREHGIQKTHVHKIVHNLIWKEAG